MQNIEHGGSIEFSAIYLALIALTKCVNTSVLYEQVSQKLLSRFRNTDKDLTYYIALEPDSTFG